MIIFCGIVVLPELLLLWLGGGGEESRDEVLGVISMYLQYGCLEMCVADELGMLHHERKTAGRRDRMVYGLATDGYKFYLWLLIIIPRYACSLYISEDKADMTVLMAYTQLGLTVSAG